MFFERHFPAVGNQDEPALPEAGVHEEGATGKPLVSLQNREGDHREQEVQAPMDQSRDSEFFTKRSEEV